MKGFTISIVILLSVLYLTGAVFAGGQQETEASGRSVDKTVAGEQEVDDSVHNWIVENTDDYITVIDSVGNKVTIEKPIKTIVGTGMGQAFSVMKAVNAEGMVSAVSEYVTKKSAFFPELSKLPAVSVGMQSVDNEMIIQLEPDFILSEPIMLPLFSDTVLADIPLLQISFNSIEAYSMFGAIIGKEAETAKFIAWIKGYTDVIDERIANLSDEEYQKVFIYYGGEYGFSAPPPYGTFGKENFLRNELITRAGGRGISQNLSGEWISVDPEWIIEQNPPVIIRECFIVNDHPELGYSANDDAHAKALMDSIMSEQPAFEDCDAVKNKRVHLIYGDLTEDSWFISLVYMAKWLHPDLFEDLDPEKIHQEYITRFQRLDFNVVAQGLFTYSAN